MPLCHDQTVGSWIANGAACAGQHCEFLRAETLLTRNSAVDDPLIDVTVAFRVAHRNGLQIVCALEVRVGIRWPVNEVH